MAELVFHNGEMYCVGEGFTTAAAAGPTSPVYTFNELTETRGELVGVRDNNTGKLYVSTEDDDDYEDEDEDDENEDEDDENHGDPQASQIASTSETAGEDPC